VGEAVVGKGVSEEEKPHSSEKLSLSQEECGEETSELLSI